MAVLSSQFWCKKFWNRTLRSWDMAILLRMWKKALKIFLNLYKVLVFWQFRGQFWQENTVFAPNPSSNLKIKHWRFQSMWNLKIDFRIIFWDILTLHPHISKSSLPTTGTFRYVESQMMWKNMGYSSLITHTPLEDKIFIFHTESILSGRDLDLAKCFTGKCNHTFSKYN